MTETIEYYRDLIAAHQKRIAKLDDEARKVHGELRLAVEGLNDARSRAGLSRWPPRDVLSSEAFVRELRDGWEDSSK